MASLPDKIPIEDLVDGSHSDLLEYILEKISTKKFEDSDEGEDQSNTNVSNETS